MEKNYTVAYDKQDELLALTTALASPLRMEIMRGLSHRAMSVKEIAFQLNIPMSTASANVKVLENANLIRTSFQSGKHGSLKLCSIRYEKIILELTKNFEREESGRYTVEMPIGGYFDVNIQPTCGIADEENFVGQDDEIRTFYSSDRFRAQLIWFSSGYLEYRFPIDFDYGAIESIQFSLECCSEAPGYRNVFPSDITFWINGVEIIEWTCPGDFGGVRGEFTPQWWSLDSTQYGLLKKITVNRSGSYLDDKFVANVTLKKLIAEPRDFISFQVGVKPTAKNMGGINLFGKKFGNYEQDPIARSSIFNAVS